MKIILATLGLFLFSHGLMAQDSKEKGNAESQQIIINQSPGAPNSTFSIQIDGDNVIVNGKPLSEFKDGEVTINKKKIIINGNEKTITTESFGNDEISSIRSSIGSPRKVNLGIITQSAKKGAKITTIMKGSPAAEAGLQANDIITKVNDSKIDGPEKLIKVMKDCKHGEQIKIKYLRKGKSKTAKVTLDNPIFMDLPKEGTGAFVFKIPHGEAEGFSMPPIELNGINGMPNLSDFNININARPSGKIGLKIQDTEDTSGVKILDVEQNSAGANAGLQKNDQIIAINGNTVKNTDEAREQLKVSNEASNYKIKVQRQGKEIDFEVTIPKKLRTANL